MLFSEIKFLKLGPPHLQSNFAKEEITSENFI